MITPGLAELLSEYRTAILANTGWSFGDEDLAKAAQEKEDSARRAIELFVFELTCGEEL